jgi:hypothetical protein
MSQRYVHPTPQRVEDAFARLDAYNQVNVSETPNASTAAVN